LIVVDPAVELEWLHDLPVELMWGVGPVTKAKLNAEGITTIGQLAATPGRTLESLVGVAASEKLGALAFNHDPRDIETDRRAHSVGAQSALGRKPFRTQIFRPALYHLADRVGSRLRAKARAGRNVTVRVRFADMRAVTRSITLPAAISATPIIAEVAEDLVRSVRDEFYPRERIITLVAISIAHLTEDWAGQFELSFGLPGDNRRPGTRRATARWDADRALDKVRTRWGWEAIGYASVVLELQKSVPDAFRELAEKNL
jgi:DNA polymerase-4